MIKKKITKNRNLNYEMVTLFEKKKDIRKIKLYCSKITFRNVFKCKSYLLKKKIIIPGKVRLFAHKQINYKDYYLQVKSRMVTLF